MEDGNTSQIEEMMTNGVGLGENDSSVEAEETTLMAAEVAVLQAASKVESALEINFEASSDDSDELNKKVEKTEESPVQEPDNSLGNDEETTAAAVVVEKLEESPSDIINAECVKSK